MSCMEFLAYNLRMNKLHMNFVFAHENVTCTSGIERDTQDTVPEETQRKRDTQDNSPSAFETQNPTRPGWSPSGCAAAMGCPRSIRSPLGLCRSKLSLTKNNDE